MAKSNQKLISIILLVVGVVLVLWGLNEFGALGSRIGRAFSGNISVRTLALLIGGGVCAALGLKGVLGK